MSLTERLARVLRAQANDLVSRAEDPRKIVEQALLDLRREQGRARAETAKAMAEGVRLRRELQLQEARANNLQERAEDALRRGQDRLARTALQGRKDTGRLVDALRMQLERHDTVVGELQTRLHTLDARLLELEGRRSLLAARTSTVHSQAILDSADGREGGGALDAIDRMERKVQGLEDEAEARAVLGRTFEVADAALLRNAEVDEELEQLRRRVLDAAKRGEDES